MADLDSKQAERKRATLTDHELEAQFSPETRRICMTCKQPFTGNKKHWNCRECVRAKSRQTPEQKNAFKQAVLAMQRTGATHKVMAEHFNVRPYVIESIVQGARAGIQTCDETFKIEYFSHIVVQQNCLKCERPFDGGKFIRMCDECKLDRDTKRW